MPWKKIDKEESALYAFLLKYVADNHSLLRQCGQFIMHYGKIKEACLKEEAKVICLAQNGLLSEQNCKQSFTEWKQREVLSVSNASK